MKTFTIITMLLYCNKLMLREDLVGPSTKCVVLYCVQWQHGNLHTFVVLVTHNPRCRGRNVKSTELLGDR